MIYNANRKIMIKNHNVIKWIKREANSKRYNTTITLSSINNIILGSSQKIRWQKLEFAKL